MSRPLILAIVFSVITYILYKIRDMNNKHGLIEIVVSRFNEPLDWLKQKPFNKHKITIYNKGDNDNFYKPPGTKIVNLKNVGRCDHTYLYHIIENYGNLENNTVFLPGSADMNYKIGKARKQVNEVERHDNTVFICTYHKESVDDGMYDFKMDNWQSSNAVNKNQNPEVKLKPAEIRPFGKWYKSKFKNKTHYISYTGILGINKKHIQQHPKKYYEELIKELNTHSNPEAGHYFERSWYAIFYPMDDAKILTCYLETLISHISRISKAIFQK